MLFKNRFQAGVVSKTAVLVATIVIIIHLVSIDQMSYRKGESKGSPLLMPSPLVDTLSFKQFC